MVFSAPSPSLSLYLTVSFLAILALCDKSLIFFSFLFCDWWFHTSLWSIFQSFPWAQSCRCRSTPHPQWVSCRKRERKGGRERFVSDVWHTEAKSLRSNHVLLYESTSPQTLQGVHAHARTHTPTDIHTSQGRGHSVVHQDRDIQQTMSEDKKKNLSFLICSCQHV